jgi:PAS domain S-box-containing protein
MSIVEPLLAGSAAVLLYVAIQHGVLAFSRPEKTDSISFALLAMLASVYVVLGLLTYKATEPAFYAQVRFLQIIASFVIGPAMAWFVKEYTGMTAWWPVVGFTLFYAVVLVVYGAGGFGPPPGLDGFPTTVLPWGEAVATKLPPSSAAGGLFFGSFLVLTGYALMGAWQEFRSGAVVNALLLTFAMSALWTNNVLAKVPGWGGMPWDEVGFFVLAVVMGFHLSRRAALVVGVEAELELSERRLRTLVEEAPYAVLLYHSGEGRYVEANEKAATLFRVDRDKLLSSDPYFLWVDNFGQPSERRATLREAYSLCLDHGHSTHEWKFDDGAGQERVWEVDLVRLPGRHPARVRVSISDVTEARQVQARQADLEGRLRQAQKLESVGQLTSGVAHDFNNLLTVILGNLEFALETAQEEGMSAEDRAPLERAVEASNRGAALTRRLLAFSRKRAIDPTTVRLADVLEGVSELLGRTLPASISMDVTVAAGLWNVRADGGLVQDALLNLCLNARDAMPDGGHLMVEAENVQLGESFVSDSRLSAGDHVVVRVHDTGDGMSPEVVDRIFEPFFTTKKADKGSGLGLSMVWGFLEQSAGSVKVASTEGEGTTIQIFLPRHADAEPVESPPPAEDALSTARGERILVVEDEEAIRRMLVSLLSQLGYVVESAGSAVAAVGLMEGRGYAMDLLLTDVDLPGGMSGVELATTVRRTQPDVPVIFTSGFVDRHADMIGSMSLVEVLPKPFHRADVVRSVSHLLKAASP